MRAFAMALVALMMSLGMSSTLAVAQPRSVHLAVNKDWEPTGRIEVRFQAENWTPARLSIQLDRDRWSNGYRYRSFQITYTGVQFTPGQVDSIRAQLVKHQLPTETTDDLCQFFETNWFRTRATADTTFAFAVHMKMPGHGPWTGQGRWTEIK